MTEISAKAQQSAASAVAVRLPAAFYPLSGGRKRLFAAGGNVREVLDSLERECPGILGRLVDDQGAVKRYVNVYVNDVDIRGLAGLDTAVAGGDLVWILPAVAGGSPAA